MAMKPEIKAKWLQALRSGEYKQGRKVLRSGERSNTKFCCLGVLCNLHAQAHPQIAAQEQSPHKYMGEWMLPPLEVYRWAGLECKDKLTIGGLTLPPEAHNDGEWDHAPIPRRTFAEIADAIEAQL